MGAVEATDLGLDGGALYNPATNYEQVRGKWLDWGDRPAPEPVSSRTVDSTAQNATVAPATNP
jgi:outer membrane protein